MAQSTIRRVKAKLENYIMISDFLGNYIIDGSDMDENTFSELAEKIPNEEGVVKAFELAPEGIISRNLSYAGKFRGSWTGCSEGTRTEKMMQFWLRKPGNIHLAVPIS